MATKKTDLDAELERLYRGPLEEFVAARNGLAKQLRKFGRGEEAGRLQALPKPTPSVWAVNVLFDRERERMEALLAAGKRARSGQREAVSGRGTAALRESLEAARVLIEELRRRAVVLLSEAGRVASRPVIERIGIDLQALAFSPAAAEAAARRWLDRDLDAPGFEVLAGLQLARSPVVDFAARRAGLEKGREKKEAPKEAARPSPATGEEEPKEKERRRLEAAERARREREEERLRRQVAVAAEKVERARQEAAGLGGEAEEAGKAASEARRRAEAADLAAGRARERAERAAERLARAQDELAALKAGQEGG
jgi:hypothetical protein